MTRFVKQGEGISLEGPSSNLKKKSRIRETKNLSTDADSRTDTILERLQDLSKKKKTKKKIKKKLRDNFF